MFYIASTRFNHATWNENTEYRRQHSFRAIYGVCIKMHEKYPLKSIIFVIEMNNDNNQICGIGLIRNSLSLDKKYKIYADHDYNRFIYKGDFWISRGEILDYDATLIVRLENILFKGKGHLKRQSGISVITNKPFLNWNYNEAEIKESIKNLFVLKFKPHTS